MRVRIQAGSLAPPEDLKRPLVVSLSAHLVIVALLMFGPAPGRGESWGGAGGGAVQVSLVSNLPGVPLPRPQITTNSRVATESPGLFREAEPKVVPQAPTTPAQADEIPSFQDSRQSSIPLPPPRRPSDRRVANPPSAVPSGEGGPPAMRYTPFNTEGGQGGTSFGGGGGFGGRYPWYVESVQRRISSNWLISTIDPYLQWSPRVTVSFDVLRDGSIVSIQIMQSSGNASVDRSTVRAIRESSPLPSLPSDFTGTRVSVEFFFDFKRR